MNWAAIIWFALMVFLIFLEANTVTLVAIWFICGSLAALISSLLGAQLWLQVVLFVAISVILLILLRPVTKKYIQPKVTKTNIDAIVGSTGVVIGVINNTMAKGTVKLGAMEWSARSSSGDILEPGTMVTVDRIEGVKVFVTPAEVKQSV